MKRWEEVVLLVLIVACGLVGWAWYQESVDRAVAEAMIEPLENEAAAARATAQAATERADSAGEVADSAAAALVLQTQRADSLEALRTQVVEDAAHVAAVAGGALDVALDSIQASLPEAAHALVDTVRARVGEIQGALETTTGAYRAQTREFAGFRLESSQVLRAEQAARTLAEQRADRWEAAHDAERALADQLRKLQTRGVWDRIRSLVPGLSTESTVAGLIGGGITYAVTR